MNIQKMPKPNSMNIAQQGVVTPSSSMRKAQASGNTVTARSTQHGGLSASSSTTSLKIPIEVNTRSSGNSLNNSGKFSASTGSQRTTPRKADQHRERNQSGDHEHQDWVSPSILYLITIFIKYIHLLCRSCITVLT